MRSFYFKGLHSRASTLPQKNSITTKVNSINNRASVLPFETRTSQLAPTSRKTHVTPALTIRTRCCTLRRIHYKNALCSPMQTLPQC